MLFIIWCWRAIDNRRLPDKLMTTAFSHDNTNRINNNTISVVSNGLIVTSLTEYVQIKSSVYSKLTFDVTFLFLILKWLLMLW